MDIEKSIEYIGYGYLSNLLKKTYRVIENFASKFLKLAIKLQFEQYRMVFGERDDDIYISTYQKSGTTLMQMILYQLTTKGDMNFNHIYDVSPWIRNASLKKQKPIELPSPRLIKTHDKYKNFPKGTKGRFIYVYRNGMDVAVSLYHQNKNYNKSNLEFENFINDFFKTKSWFKHTQSWLKNERKFPILYVRYEDLLKNKKTEINRIIEFCDLQPNQDAIDRAIKYSSFDYMKRNESKFGDQPQERKQVYDQFIRKGKVGEGKKEFSKNQKKIFESFYNKMVKPLETCIFN